MSLQQPQDIRRTVVILVKNDMVLLGRKKHGFGENMWSGAGGKPQPGETLEQAMIRKAQIELNITPLSYQHVAELAIDQSDEAPEPWHMQLHVYLCDSWNGQPTETDELTPKWFPITALPYSDMWEDSVMWLPHALKYEHIKGEFLFDKHDRLMRHSLTFLDALTPLES